MSKRFPIPEFDRDRFKNMSWSAPALLSASDQARLAEAGQRGDPSSFGTYAVAVPAAFAQTHSLVGPHLHATMCIVPRRSVHIVGRSWAWPIERALVVQSLQGESSPVVADWTTPRPMSTRLGPQDGIEIDGGVFYVIMTHRYGQTWIGNRTLSTCANDGQGGCLEVMSACGEDADDFHACNLTAHWSA